MRRRQLLLPKRTLVVRSLPTLTSFERMTRKLLQEFLPRPWLFKPDMAAGQLLQPMLPQKLKNKIPKKQDASALSQRQHARNMLVLDGCVQPGDVVQHQSCCGAGVRCARRAITGRPQGRLLWCDPLSPERSGRRTGQYAAPRSRNTAICWRMIRCMRSRTKPFLR